MTPKERAAALQSPAGRAAKKLFDSVQKYVNWALGKRDKKIEALEARLAELAEKSISLERRASRHADHLANLESKLRKREGKA